MKPGAKISVLLVLPLGGEAKQASDEAGLDFWFSVGVYLPL